MSDAIVSKKTDMIWYGRIIDITPLQKKDKKSRWREGYIGISGVISFPYSGNQHYMNFTEIVADGSRLCIGSMFHTGAGEFAPPGKDQEGKHFTFTTKRSIYEIELLKMLQEAAGFVPFDDLLKEVEEYRKNKE